MKLPRLLFTNLDSNLLKRKTSGPPADFYQKYGDFGTQWSVAYFFALGTSFRKSHVGLGVFKTGITSERMLTMKRVLGEYEDG